MHHKSSTDPTLPESAVYFSSQQESHEHVHGKQNTIMYVKYNVWITLKSYSICTSMYHQGPHHKLDFWVSIAWCFDWLQKNQLLTFSFCMSVTVKILFRTQIGLPRHAEKCLYSWEHWTHSKDGVLSIYLSINLSTLWLQETKVPVRVINSQGHVFWSVKCI